ncbi:MAG: hypothetical protein K8F91_25095, partial [Candidatus Obscuribacterales bacterium]|nr:hypothetical protein [Candidatus Obscuribacterales bacterium]
MADKDITTAVEQTAKGDQADAKAPLTAVTGSKTASTAIVVCQILLFLTGLIWALFMVPHGHLD